MKVAIVAKDKFKKKEIYPEADRISTIFKKKFEAEHKILIENGFYIISNTISNQN